MSAALITGKRVLVVDPSPSVQHALAGVALAMPDIAQVRRTGYVQLPSLVRELRPHVVVAGVTEVDVRELLERTTAALEPVRPPAGLVVFGPAEPEPTMAALEVGAAAYVPRTAHSRPLLVASIRAAALLPLATDLTPVTKYDGPPLSDRELEVLQAAAQGKSNAEIGTELHLSPMTVKSHLRRIGRKLRTSTRAGAVGAGLRYGLVHA